MPAKTRAESYDDDSGSGEDISMDKVYQTKKDLDEVKSYVLRVAANLCVPNHLFFFSSRQPDQK